jgi:hypothetical protein
MTELDRLIKSAYASEGDQQDSNKVYTVFFRTHFFIPALSRDKDKEEFSPLIIEDHGKYFIPVFDSLLRLQLWSQSDGDKVPYIELSGEDVVRGVVDEQVYICLNPGGEYYKEFSPDEIMRLKMMLSKIEKMRGIARKKKI